MAYFAELDSNNVVTRVLTSHESSNYNPEVELKKKYKSNFKKTSYNTIHGVHYDANRNPSADQSKAFRKNFAGVGFAYDEGRDAFIPPQPFPSWTLDEEKCVWEPPVAMPTDGKRYIWDENAQNWAEVEEPAA